MAVTQCINSFCFCAAADSTGKGLDTFLGTGRIGGYLAVIVGVTQSFDLFFVRITANRTVIDCTAGLGASCSGCCGLIAVTQCGDLFLCSQSLATDGALLAISQTGFGAGCSLTGNGFFGVPQCGNLGLSDQDFAAYIAMLT